MRSGDGISGMDLESVELYLKEMVKKVINGWLYCSMYDSMLCVFVSTHSKKVDCINIVLNAMPTYDECISLVSFMDVHGLDDFLIAKVMKCVERIHSFAEAVRFRSRLL